MPLIIAILSINDMNNHLQLHKGIAPIMPVIDCDGQKQQKHVVDEKLSPTTAAPLSLHGQEKGLVAVLAAEKLLAGNTRASLSGVATLNRA